MKNNDNKKDLVTRLYRNTEFAQAIIESNMDSIIKNEKNIEFDVILLNFIEVCANLLRFNY